MKLILVDTNLEVYKAFEQYFGQLKNVEFHLCEFQKITEYDCIVSPANSFGLMNGGLDKHLVNYFGKNVEERVQEYIATEYYGEQPVGTSFIIETGDEKHPYLAHTPTMRIPSKISKTDNVYRAMRALLIAVDKYNKTHNNVISSVLCTGLGTMIGGVEPDVAVEQMYLAYHYFLNPVKVSNWFEGTDIQRKIDKTNGIIW